MSREPYSGDWRAHRQKNAGKIVLMTCGMLFAVPLFFFFFAVVMAIFFGEDSSASNGREVQRIDQQLTMTTAPAAEGLDLQAVMAAFKEAPNAESFEKVLNDPESGLNNLDLNADGKVDFIKVTEYGNQKDTFGFALTTEPEAGNEQEVAKIELFKNGNNVDAQVVGNEQIYGSNYGFANTAMNVASIAMLAYLISNRHQPYRSPYYYGYYPSYYRPYPYVGVDSYRNRSSRYYNNVSSLSRISQPRSLPSDVRNPKAGAVATAGIGRSLSKPTPGQTSFQNKFKSNLQSQKRTVSSRSSGSVRGSSGRSSGSGK